MSDTTTATTSQSQMEQAPPIQDVDAHTPHTTLHSQCVRELFVKRNIQHQVEEARISNVAITFNHLGPVTKTHTPVRQTIRQVPALPHPFSSQASHTTHYKHIATHQQHVNTTNLTNIEAGIIARDSINARAGQGVLFTQLSNLKASCFSWFFFHVNVECSVPLGIFFRLENTPTEADHLSTSTRQSCECVSVCVLFSCPRVDPSI